MTDENSQLVEALRLANGAIEIAGVGSNNRIDDKASAVFAQSARKLEHKQRVNKQQTNGTHWRRANLNVHRRIVARRFDANANLAALLQTEFEFELRTQLQLKRGGGDGCKP